MVELKWNIQFHFNSGQFHFAIPIPWLAIPIPIPILELELELKSIPIPIPELTPALLLKIFHNMRNSSMFYIDLIQRQKVSPRDIHP